MLKLCFYVPAHSLEVVKEACFEAGAGRIGNYDRCAWQTLGQGQFRPLQGANPSEGAAPSEGSMGKLETLEEYQVEMILDDNLLTPVIQALKAAHPYEEPAYSVIQVLNT